jgi:putative metallohydrolase (TIGR04338 family)
MLDWSDEERDAYKAYERKKELFYRRGGRNSSRDSERSKTYRSEWAFQSKMGSGKEFKTIKEAQKYADKVTKSVTWGKVTRKNGGVGVNKTRLEYAASRRNGTTAGYAFIGGRIKLYSSGMNEYTLLHELAHQAGYMHHGQGFRQCLVKLVSRFMGRDAAKALKAEFKERKLRMTVPKIKEPEVWLKSYRRMKELRARKNS